MTVYSYIVVNDHGFAPNPFHGICTIACCKPEIRKAASVGDLVVGMTTRGEQFVYAMKVARVISFADYWRDPQYAAKRPDMRSTRAIDQYGDNIYEPTGMGEFRQVPSHHCKPADTESERLKHKQRDLGGVHVLVAKDFAYFGKEGPGVPPELAFLKTGRGHRCRFTPEQVQIVGRWFQTLPQGVHGRPALWPAGDVSWRQQ